MTTRSEQVDVAIVGGGLAGLACAVAVHKVRPHARIKVYERRKAPPGFDSTQEPGGSDSRKKSDKKSEQAAAATTADDNWADDEQWTARLGGGVRLEMNGLKAIAAISKDLAGSVVGEGLYASKVLLHDTQGGAVMSRLHEAPHPSAPSPRQPALMVGWSELEALLLDRLPPGTVEWEAVVTGYTDSPAGNSVSLNLLMPSDSDEPVLSHALSTAMTHALDVELHQHMQQQRDQIELEEGSFTQAVPASPFSNAAGSSPFSGTGPAAAAAPVAAAALLTAHRLERLTVRAKLLVAADGPMSLLRQQCVADGQPDFEGMVRWVGRLPGDMLSTIPVEQEAWWMGGGMTFASHPLSGGDVAWEAQVSSSCLAKAGLKWDQQTQAIIKDVSSNTQQQDSTAAGNATSSADIIIPPAAHAAAAAAAPAGADSVDGGRSSSSVKRHSRAAVPADAPAGEDQGAAPAAAAASVATFAAAAALAQAVASAPTTPRAAAATSSSSNARETANGAASDTSTSSSSNSTRHVNFSSSHPQVIRHDAAATGSGVEAPGDVKVLLTELFANFPRACLDMINTTDASTILEGPVLTRPARQMPACMGRGSVVVLGEAAHPVRPSGQEASQAFEDAAEFGACVMHWGISREALRRFELRRRPRWTHVMQVSQAFGSVTNLGGVALHQGLLDYTAQLYHARFVPLRSVDLSHHQKRRNPWLHWAGVALLTYGTVAAAGLTHRHFAKQGKSPLGSVLKDPLAQAVVDAVDAVGQSAVDVYSTAAQAVQSPGQTAAVLKEAAKKGVSATVQGSGQAAAALGNQVRKVARIGAGDGDDGSSNSESVVYGEVPPRRRKGVFARVRDGAVNRTLHIGAVLSRPFTHVLGHQVRSTVAESLGAF